MIVVHNNSIADNLVKIKVCLCMYIQPLENNKKADSFIRMWVNSEFVWDRKSKN